MVDDLFYCNSYEGEIYKNDKCIFKQEGMWTRGLCVYRDRVYFGMSGQRNTSIVEATLGGEVITTLTVPLMAIYSIIVGDLSNT
jgi:hypothetical protein